MDGSTGLKALKTLLNILQSLILLSGWFVAALILGFTIKSGLQPFLAMFIATLLGLVALVVHEGGHYLGARINAMPVLLARIAAVEISVQRRGWRLRWSPQLKRNRLGGYVMAASNLQRPLRQQWMLMVLMGPLLNLLMAALALGLGLHLATVPGAIVLAFAAINLSMGLGNLLPACRVSPSDGMVLLAWCLHRDDQRAELAQARLLALSVAGVASSQLPAADLERIAQGPMPEPLVAFSYRLSAVQERGDWLAALHMSQELEQLLKARAGELNGMSTLIELLRGELAFCRAYLLQDATLLKDAALSADADWYSPWLLPRCQALRAILAGDRAQAERHLAQALQAADNSQMLSQIRTEKHLADNLLQIQRPDKALSMKIIGPTA